MREDGLWGYETSSGDIPLPHLSHGWKKRREKKRREVGFYAVNFAAALTGLRGKRGAARLGWRGRLLVEGVGGGIQMLTLNRTQHKLSHWALKRCDYFMFFFFFF